jgi:hypothetical protein
MMNYVPGAVDPSGGPIGHIEFQLLRENSKGLIQMSVLENGIDRNSTHY